MHVSTCGMQIITFLYIWLFALVSMMSDIIQMNDKVTLTLLIFY